MNLIFTFIKSIIFDLFIALWCIVICIIFFPFGRNKKTALFIGRVISFGFVLGSKYIIGMRYKCPNLKEIDKGGYLILSKHQSPWETTFFGLHLKNAVYILKSNLKKIPFYGWYLDEMQMISINRNGGISEMKRMNAAILQRLKSGLNVVIFPQGTRTLPHQNNSEVKYKLGCLDIFNNYTGKIAIMALDSGICWPKGAFSLKKSGTINLKLIKTMEITPEIYKAKKHEIRAMIENEIEEKSEKLYRKRTKI